MKMYVYDCMCGFVSMCGVAVCVYLSIYHFECIVFITGMQYASCLSIM